jgi:hypothetical protein
MSVRSVLIFFASIFVAVFVIGVLVHYFRIWFGG